MQELGHDVRELRSRKGAFQAIISGRMPVPNQPGYLKRLAEAHCAESVECFVIVATSRKAQARTLAASRAVMLEKSGVMSLHVAQMHEHRSGEIIPARKPGKSGKLPHPFLIGRQRVDLLVGNHLQPILNSAQETISGGKVAVRLRINPTSGIQCVEGREGPPRAQLRMTSAGDELLSLHEKFDLADAAASQLDVVPLNGDVVVTAISVNLSLHRVHIGDRCKVQILAPNKRGKLGEELLT